MPLAAQFQSGHVCSVCDSPSVIRVDARGERRDSRSQGSVISRARNEQFCMSASPLPGWRNREYQQRHHRERTNRKNERAMEKHFEIPYLTPLNSAIDLLDFFSWQSRHWECRKMDGTTARVAQSDSAELRMNPNLAEP